MAQAQEMSMQVRSKTIYDMLSKRHDALAALLPKYLTPERMIRGVLAQATRNPKLLQCTPISILNGVLVAAQLGLEIGRIRGGGYLVPFKNKKTGQYEATFIPDYRGLMNLAFLSGIVFDPPRAVHKGDEFDYGYGLDSHLTHKPKGDADAKTLTHVYAVARVKGEPHPFFTVLTRHDVELTMNRSRAKDDGPWITDYEAMALKTVVKKLCNWLPQAQGDEPLVKAVEYDGRADAGEAITDLFSNLESDAQVVESTTDKLKAKLAAPVEDAKVSESPAPDSAEPDQQEDSGGPAALEKFSARVAQCQTAKELHEFWNSTAELPALAEEMEEIPGDWVKAKAIHAARKDELTKAEAKK